MADLVSFFSLSTLFLAPSQLPEAGRSLPSSHCSSAHAMPSSNSYSGTKDSQLLAGATNTNNGSLAMKAYWNEVFPGIPMPDVIRALLPSPNQTSGLVGRGYGNVDIDPRSFRSWIRLWSVLGDAHKDRSNNWSPNLAPLYFLRKDLLSGSKMNVTMMITPSADEAKGKFATAELIPPFSSLDLVEVCNRNNCNIGLLAYTPLGGGSLSGKYLDMDSEAAKKGRLNLFPGYMERYRSSLAKEVTELYVQLAKKHGLTPTQLALGFVRDRPFMTSSVIGVTSLEQLKEDLDVYALARPLPAEVLSGVEDIFKRYKDPSIL
ncbi:Aldo-keto reductase [Nymphaea thermarum]|nr:Aldo-keto reductase [Nymphaea thermarum]